MKTFYTQDLSGAFEALSDIGNDLRMIKARIDALEHPAAEPPQAERSGSLVERVEEEIKNGMLETFNVNGDEWTTDRASIRAIRAVADWIEVHRIDTGIPGLLRAQLEPK